MSFLNAYQLLFNAAHETEYQKQAFSTQEIVKRINEIKYLSAQKKVPRLSLRKEIVHLENKLESIFEVEKKLAAQKRRESAKITALKQQNADLLKRIAAAGDEDVQKRMQRLTSLLGEYAAQKNAAEDIKAAWSELQGSTSRSDMNAPAPVISKVETQERIAALQDRLIMLKQELEIQKVSGKKALVQQLEQKVPLIEEKLESIGARTSTSMVRSPEIKHTLLFKSPSLPVIDAEDMEEEKELPLPPPPKMRVK